MFLLLWCSFQITHLFGIHFQVDYLLLVLIHDLTSLIGEFIGEFELPPSGFCFYLVRFSYIFLLKVLSQACQNQCLICFIIILSGLDMIFVVPFNYDLEPSECVRILIPNIDSPQEIITQFKNYIT